LTLAPWKIGDGGETMRVNGHDFRSIWLDDDGLRVAVIDQTRLPHEFVTRALATADDAARAIRDMWVRGAPLIGATAAYGIALAMNEDASDGNLHAACDFIAAARPTAINLAWAIGQTRDLLDPLPPSERLEAAYAAAAALADEDVAINSAIGDRGLKIFREIAARKPAGEPLNILTHCNAGWLATVDWGTATSPIYKAHDSGVKLHVYVSETRPRNQGASLTAWELANHGVPHTLVVDNSGGHLMQRGMVDLVITGTDRVTANGDVCNKIGTYLKALAARDNGVPFYVAAPSPSIDFNLADGADIPIETRGAAEVTHISGRTDDGRIETVRISPEQSPALNHGFDVTPARLVTGLLTERGLVGADRAALAALFPERVGGR
jgi:methylthioribose-1-phosphate isomerase